MIFNRLNFEDYSKIKDKFLRLSGLNLMNKIIVKMKSLL